MEKWFKFRKIAFRLISPSFQNLLRQLFFKNSIKPQMEADDRKFLQDHYREDVKKLRDILGYELPWNFN